MGLGGRAGAGLGGAGECCLVSSNIDKYSL
jgi:hypothetical protein